MAFDDKDYYEVKVVLLGLLEKRSGPSLFVHLTPSNNFGLDKISTTEKGPFD